jgi:hypothetical protein
MEAASALTALQGEEDTMASSSTKSSRVSTPSDNAGAKDNSKDEKRFLPDHKKPDAALTFPEKVGHSFSFPVVGYWIPPPHQTAPVCSCALCIALG